MHLHAVHGTTRLLGLIGDPVGHSLSPTMHNAALTAAGLDFVYVPLPVKAKDLPAAVAGLKAIGCAGFNVTIPHKQRIVELLNWLEPPARAVGAVNTVRIEADGTLTGTNTDVVGFLAPLAEGRDWTGRTATVLGNGGAALAVVVACRALGFARIEVAGRDPVKLSAFLTRLSDLTGVHPREWSTLDNALEQTDLLVNTTPLGMYPQTDTSPLDSLVGMKPDAVVYDLIYRPRPTRLLGLATALGLQAVDGLPMLVAQAEAALTFWTGVTPHRGVMGQAAEVVLADLRRAESSGQR